MRPELVIGNPPYDKDIYLDFVTQAHELSKDYTVMITPAKWQAKAGKKNEEFRQEVVPYMKDIVYYPETTDVFDIQESSGICYYLIGKCINDVTIRVENKSDDIEAFRSVAKYNSSDFLNISLLNVANSIIVKASKDKKLRIVPDSADFYVVESRLFGWGTERVKNNIVYKACKFYTNDLKSNVISDLMIVSANDLHTLPKVRAITFSSNDIKECESYKSYMSSKFVKFLLLAGRVGVMTNFEAKRFIPTPTAFDHIFTDEELYTRYNLTPDEIQLIESVIKTRTKKA